MRRIHEKRKSTKWLTVAICYVIVLWLVIFVGIVVSFTFYPLATITRLNDDPVMRELSFWIVNSTVFLTVGPVSVAALAISWARVKDPTLKRHL